MHSCSSHRLGFSICRTIRLDSRRLNASHNCSTGLLNAFATFIAPAMHFVNSACRSRQSIDKRIVLVPDFDS